MLTVCVTSLSFCAAKHILSLFRVRFNKEMESKSIVYDLESKGIITNGVFNEVIREADRTLQNKILYEFLKRTCTKDSLMAVCDVIIAVEGNPLMKRFGEDMKRMLEGEWCACSHMYTASMCSVCTCSARLLVRYGTCHK